MAEEVSLKLSEEEVKALKELAEIAVNLKNAGLLDFLRFVSEKAEDATVLLAYYPPLFRALALLDGALEAFEKTSPDDVIAAKLALTNVSRCGLKALAEAGKSKPKKVGLTGLMSALRDPDVQTGLGLLLAIAKQLGACIRQSYSEKA